MTVPSTPQDMARFGALVRLAGELIESSGWRAVAVTDSWSRGVQSANLDPDAGGWRYEVIEHVNGRTEIVPIPADRTGEGALRADQLDYVHANLTSTFDALGKAADETVRLLRLAVPSPLAVLRPDDLTPAQISAAGWCVSCWRDHGYHEPVAMRPNGERRYRDLCLWDGEFAAAHDGMHPPLELVEARHRGQRITQQMVTVALDRAEQRRREEKAKRKKKGGKRAA